MVWIARNTGLTGAALNVNYIIQNASTRQLPNTGHILLIATDGGIFRSENGGRAWGQLILPDPSNAEFADSPAATVDELTFHWVSYGPFDLSDIFVIGAKSSVSRVWIYKSVNAGATWISRGVIAT